MLKSFYEKGKIEAGCDEAGRGCLAGPVFAASVILPPDFKNEMLDDSKKLSEKKRYILRDLIIKEAIDWSVQSLDNNKIDEINILNASILAMQNAVGNLKTKPDLLLIDGNRFKPYKDIPHVCIIKGDGKYASIAAASILAKTFRDDFMFELSKEFPIYEWNKNKGYPTQVHIKKTMEHGFSKYHRRTFQPKALQLSLSF